MRFRSRSTRALVGRLLALSTSAVALPTLLSGQTSPVYPGDPNWFSQTVGGATAQITGTQPRSGNGSLQLQTSGQLADWGYYISAGDPLTSSFGMLDQLSQASFDWLRVGVNLNGADAPWLAQTPVFRLYVRQNLGNGAFQFSQLVWERYYNNGSPTPLDTWQSEDLLSQKFWRVTLNGATRSYTRAGCAGGPLDPLFPLLTLTPLTWAGAGGCYDPLNTFVYGVGVGVGSNWPRPYTGFADNVQLSFGPGGTHIGANFELAPQQTTPEPMSGLLVGGGLAAIGLWTRGYRRRRRDR
jgi:hypothetical protein